MNFFAQQDKARSKTRTLVALYLIAVVAIAAVIYLGVCGAYNLYYADQGREVIRTADRTFVINRPFSLWNPDLFWTVNCFTLSIILLGTLYKMMQLSEGGSAVARLLGGRRIIPETLDPKEKQLLNVVEEIAIASGTAAPPVYLLPENSINAFAAGLSSRDAVIGVTRGALLLLSRDELQGVIAHEFGHIFNGDMRLNLRIMGVLHGILLLSLVGRGLLRGRLKGRMALLYLVAIVLIIVGYIGLFFANLIKFAISREREYLADASSVQFTRNPDGIAGALKKIGGLERGSQIENENAEQASHFFFAEGMKLSSLFSSHPPLDERIRRIDPSFDGKYPKVAMPESEVLANPYQPLKKKQAFVPPAALGAGLTQHIAQPGREHLDYTASLIERIPPIVRKAAAEPLGARAIVFSLLLDRKDEKIRVQQNRYLEGFGEYGVSRRLTLISDVVRGLDTALRLPLLDLCFPALSTLSVRQYATFRENIQNMIAADNRVELFEFVLAQILYHHLDPHCGYRGPKTKLPEIKNKMEAVWILLSGLSHAGQTELQSAAAAFIKAAQTFGSEGEKASLISRAAVTASQMEAALEVLKNEDWSFKKKIVEAGAIAVQNDGKIMLEESELLRAFADTFDCPLPPLPSVLATV